MELLEAGNRVMICGASCTGKTTMIRDMITNRLIDEHYTEADVHYNHIEKFIRNVLYVFATHRVMITFRMNGL